jgi:lysophospholipase L1-like esterase
MMRDPSPDGRGAGVIVARLMALMLSGLLGLVLLEVGLRVARPEQFHPYYPNSAHHVYPSEEITPGVSGVSRFSTNSFGTRGREPSGRERLRILTIGGSTTADSLLDDSEAWPAVLEAKLNSEAASDDLVWVANSGVDGLNSHHHLMHATYLLPRLPQMDYVVVYAGMNDMGLWLHHREFDPDYLEDPDHWHNRIGEAFRSSAYTPDDWPVYKRTATWKALSRLKDRFLSARSREETQGHRVIVQDAQLEWLKEERKRRSERVRSLLPKGKMETLPLALQSYREILQRIAAEIRANGAEPIFITQAVQSVFRNEAERARLWMGELGDGEGYVSEDHYPGILDRFNQQMRDVAASDGILLIDLPHRIECDGSLFYDGMHFNEHGARVAATAIAEAIVEAGLLARAEAAADAPAQADRRRLPGHASPGSGALARQ